MSETISEKEQSMRDYLLGKLTEEESAGREDAWFESDEETERLEAVRAELIDEYLTDSFSIGEKHDFERRFLATAHNAKLVAMTKIQRELIDRKTITNFDKASLTVAEANGSNVSGWQKIKDLFSFKVNQIALVASVLAVSFGLFLAVQNFRRGDSEVAKVFTPTPAIAPAPSVSPVSPVSAPTAEITVPERPAPDLPQRKNDAAVRPVQPETRTVQTPKPIPVSTPATKQRSAIAAFALVLAVRGENSSQSKLLELYKETKTVQLSYEMPALMDNYEGFSAALIDEKSGKIVFEQKLPDLNFRQKGANLSASLPAKNLETGNYQFVLRGTPRGKAAEVIMRYGFKVQNK